MNYPPPWMDRDALREHISCADTTIDNWVSQGILPPPRKRGNKLMWKWSEVDDWLTNGQNAASPAGITDAVKRERQASH